MVLAVNTTVPEPCCLYTAAKVWIPALKPSITATEVARTESLPATRSELFSEIPATSLSTWTFMKPKDCPVLPSMFAVRNTSTRPEAGTVKGTDGPTPPT